MKRAATSPVRAWQRMLSGRRLDLLDPSPVDIEIEDIAHGLARVADAVLSVLPLAEDVEQPAGYMQHCRLPAGQTTAAQEAFIDLVGRAAACPARKVEAIERHEFYRRIEGASLIVQSGEPTAYGNAILCKGVICPDDGR